MDLTHFNKLIASLPQADDKGDDEKTPGKQGIKAEGKDDDSDK